MQKILTSMLLGASLSVMPALAMAQDNNNGAPPTAEGAASMQGQLRQKQQWGRMASMLIHLKSYGATLVR